MQKVVRGNEIAENSRNKLLLRMDENDNSLSLPYLSVLCKNTNSF
jgi:hypothetical protein